MLQNNTHWNSKFSVSRRNAYFHFYKNLPELVKRIYEAQKDNPTKGDFIKLVKKDLEMIEQDFAESV